MEPSLRPKPTEVAGAGRPQAERFPLMPVLKNSVRPRMPDKNRHGHSSDADAGGGSDPDFAGRSLSELCAQPSNVDQRVHSERKTA